jgi:cytochrome P450
MHPRVTSKLRAEFTSNPISSPIKDSEARELPYLQAIIKEGLRIFPPVVGLMSKEVPPGGDVINNKFVPGGTKIGFGALGIFRNQDMWGQDADQFRPERWIECSPEKLKEMDSTLELVFGWGKYQCLGKNLAMMELNKIFVEVDPEKSSCGIFTNAE